MEEIDDFAASHGLRIRPWASDQYAAPAVATFNTLSERRLAAGSRNGERMDLSICVVEEAGLNAWACTLPTTDLIGINIETLPLLHATARAIASHPSFFPQRCTAGGTHPQIVSTATPMELASGFEVLEAGPLPDSLREDLADSLYQAAGQFVLQHEFGHIYYGHTEWLDAKRGLALVSEMSGAAFDSPRSYERETLEWDADQFALQECLAGLLHPEIEVVGGRGAWKIPDKNKCGTADETTQLVVAALMLCAGYFASQDGSDPLDPEPRSHPHPIFRATYSLIGAANVIAFRTGQDFGEIFDRIVPIVPQTINAWTSVFPNSETFGEFAWGNEVLWGEFARRHALWEDCWTELHPELDALKRGGVLPPARPSIHPAFPDAPLPG